jgi:hypothetical protein
LPAKIIYEIVSMLKAKIALKFLWTASTLHRSRRRTDWYRLVAIFSTLVTVGLMALYISRNGVTG